MSRFNVPSVRARMMSDDAMLGGFSSLVSEAQVGAPRRSSALNSLAAGSLHSATKRSVAGESITRLPPATGSASRSALSEIQNRKSRRGSVSLTPASRGDCSSVPNRKPPRDRKPKSADVSKKEKPQKKKRKQPPVYKHVNPVNKAEERELFLDDPTRNPQFEYAKKKKCAQMYKIYSKPSTHLMYAAVRILDKVIAKYGKESAYLNEAGGDILTREEATEEIQSWLQSHNIENMIKLQFSSKTIAPAAMAGNTMILACKPMRCRRNRISGVCNHELGTHFMRRVNDQQQIWHKRRPEFGLHPFVKTEEGLACLNTHLEIKDKFLWNAALHYYAAVKGHSMSFSQLFKDLEKYVDTPERRWIECMRVKRGLTDTSLPGSFCKDQCYLEGSVAILQRRNDLDFKTLYAGRIALEDYDSVRGMALTSELLLPNFIKDIETYKEKLEEIIQTNELQDLCNLPRAQRSVLSELPEGPEGLEDDVTSESELEDGGMSDISD